MSTYNYIEYQVQGKVAVITLASADGLNTMSAESVEEWIAAISRANADSEVGAILINAKGRVFSAGADLKKVFLPRLRGEIPYDDNDPYLGGIAMLTTDWVDLLRQSKPVVAAIQAAAIGGGITAFLPADIIVASESASFSFPFVKLGIVPELCSSRYLSIRVGFAKASELILTAASVDAAQAAEIGLVNCTVPDDQLFDRAFRFAATMAEQPALMQKLSKQLLDQNLQEPELKNVWQRESDALRECFASEEHRKAVAQFLK